MSEFVEPSPSPIMISLAQAIWPLYAHMRFGDLHLDVSAEVYPAFQKLHGVGTIICSNHPASEDAEVMFGLSAEVGEQFVFLTARELFHEPGSVRMRWLQKLGCYSVERGTCDIDAFKATRDLLIHGEHKISIFPEGEVTYENQFLLDLENGPEQIALSALAELRKTGSTKQICILPLAFRYRYKSNIVADLRMGMAQAEKSLGIHAQPQARIRQRIKNAYEKMLDVLEVSLENKCHSGAPLSERIMSLQDRTITEVSAGLQLSLPSNLSTMCRIHLLKNALSEMQCTVAKGIDNDHPRLTRGLRQTYSLKLLRAIRLGGVRDCNFDQPFSQEQVSELLSTLLWETCGALTLRRPDIVAIGAAEAVDVADYLQLYRQNKRAAIEGMKGELARRISARLLELEQANRPHIVD